MKPATKKAKKPAKRVRRSAGEAREAILDAAEQRLVASGPAGIRLQDVAEDVGVSHSNILHHFGSREHLVQAVARRRVEGMRREFASAFVGTVPEEASVLALFERLYAVFGPGGHARVAAFLALEGRPLGAEPQSIGPSAELAHAARLARLPEGAAAPDFEDTYFTVLLSAMVLFAEAIVGPLFRGEPDGLRDEAVSKRFRTWAAKRLLHMLRDVDAQMPAPKARKK